MLGWEDSLEKGMEPTPVFLLGESHGVTNQTQLSNLHYYYYSDDKRGLPRWCSGEESASQCRRHKRCRFDPCVRRSPGVGNGNPLQYSCLENFMDRVA